MKDGDFVFAKSSEADYKKYQACGSELPEIPDDDEDEMGPENKQYD